MSLLGKYAKAGGIHCRILELSKKIPKIRARELLMFANNLGAALGH
jgi:hypothetical protein